MTRTFTEIIKENKQFKLSKSVFNKLLNSNKDVKKRIELFSKKISNEDGTKYENELKRTYDKLEKELQQNEIFKYGIVSSKDSNTTFKNLTQKGINVDALEREFEKKGYRHVVSTTAGLNRVGFESEKAIITGFIDSVNDMFKKLKKEGYNE